MPAKKKKKNSAAAVVLDAASSTMGLTETSAAEAGDAAHQPPAASRSAPKGTGGSLASAPFQFNVSVLLRRVQALFPAAAAAALVLPRAASVDAAAVIADLILFMPWASEVPSWLIAAARPVLSECLTRWIRVAPPASSFVTAPLAEPLRDALLENLAVVLSVAPHVAPLAAEIAARVLADPVRAITEAALHTEPAATSSAADRVAMLVRLLRVAPRIAGAAAWDWSRLTAQAGCGNAQVAAASSQASAALLHSFEPMTFEPLEVSCARYAEAQRWDERIEREELAVELSGFFDSAEPALPGDFVLGTPSAPLTANVDVHGVLLPIPPSSGRAAGRAVAAARYVHTPTSAENLVALATAVLKTDPILIEGPPGAGKTTLVEELARAAGVHDLVKLHLDDQVDAKVLLGAYVCTDVPGEFRWQPGALAQVVSEGRWVVFEDIDLAPLDVLSMIVSLVESRALFIPSRGEMIEARPGFQLFATRSTRVEVASRAGFHASMVSSGWTHVRVDAMTSTDIATILASAYPRLVPFLNDVLGTFRAVLASAPQSAMKAAAAPADVPPSSASGTEQLAGGDESDVESALPTGRQVSGRTLSTRDVFKWARRVHAHLARMESTPTRDRIKELVFQEAFDCFCAFIPSQIERQRLMCTVAAVWGLGPAFVERLLATYRPALHVTAAGISAGRVVVSRAPQSAAADEPARLPPAQTIQFLRLLEQVSVCIQHNEPALLVGETGVGKTTAVQHLARLVGRRLVVLNMSQQTDATELMGGFKPVDVRSLVLPLKARFLALFSRTFSRKANIQFLDGVENLFSRSEWDPLFDVFRKAYGMAAKKLGPLVASSGTVGSATTPGPNDDATAGDVEPNDDATSASITSRSTGAKRRAGASAAEGGRRKKLVKDDSAALWTEWADFSGRVVRMQQARAGGARSFSFAFVEGALVRALREGYWVLLDEVNLAPTELLESLSTLVDGGSVSLTDRGDVQAVERHRDFRLFACMNPPTDVGKKDLPPGLRNRFTELYVDDVLVESDLQTIVRSYLGDLPVDAALIVDFYMRARELARTELADGANQAPHFSLRTLCRSLVYVARNAQRCGTELSLYEGFGMSFLTQLNRRSYDTLLAMLSRVFKRGSELAARAALPSPGANYVFVEGYWLEHGPLEPSPHPGYILTASVQRHVRDLARIVAGARLPVLLQGPTSAGKTSMVEYLAHLTGHRFVRINNHEHTDLQEYLGTYVTGTDGRLEFKEGVLVDAVRKGHWVVLDELNLAPSEVLEALNRLLDDNRELFIPETQELILPHPHFMVFATQNPPGLYGGRKALSRAFRNRFIEIHVDDIPEDELEVILERRCALPASFSRAVVAVLRDLSRRRQGTQVFAGKHGYVTLRDLFRWAGRRPGDRDELLRHGYELLGERLRRPEERVQLLDALHRALAPARLDPATLYASTELDAIFERYEKHPSFVDVVFTPSMRRLFYLVGQCLRHEEPVLLVGETGTGKTTVCQMHAELLGAELSILNCHQHTETADFLGGLRPVRNAERLRRRFSALLQKCVDATFSQRAENRRSATLLERVVADVPAAANAVSSGRLDVARLPWSHVPPVYLAAASFFDAAGFAELEDDGDDESGLTSAREWALAQLEWRPALADLHAQLSALFLWTDGPLASSMRCGGIFLVDEISLAEDSVLERLNSVLEPSRLLVLAEKGGDAVEEIVAHPDFRMVATMNPGGDFGKKELSPAMRNRFTEIWVPELTERADLQAIVARHLSADAEDVGARRVAAVVDFVELFRRQLTILGRALSLRDVLGWCGFVQAQAPADADETTWWTMFLHGASLVFLDGIAISGPRSHGDVVRSDLRRALLQFVPHGCVDSEHADEFVRTGLLYADPPASPLAAFAVPGCPFTVPCGNLPPVPSGRYAIAAGVTRRNVSRLLRALQLRRSVLLEGSPGVGKTSMVMAVAALVGRECYRINLSEQTDMMDLLGSDMPDEDGNFRWCDGVFLRALKEGAWVLLDELNLASQSVLEGLNAVLDHRAQVYLPELDRTFVCPTSFRIFACQNPLSQGGGRKGLPKSFLNRFSAVYLEDLSPQDLLETACGMYPEFDTDLLRRMVDFIGRLHHATAVEHRFGRRGSPWEFNLRDVMRWCELLLSSRGGDGRLPLPDGAAETLFIARFREADDRVQASKLYESVFSRPLYPLRRGAGVDVEVRHDHVRIGAVTIDRRAGPRRLGSVDDGTLIMQHNDVLERMARATSCGWMTLLVGPASAGKRSLVRALAQLCNESLQEFYLNSAVDTTEVVGGFEQVSLERVLRGLEAELDDTARWLQYVLRVSVCSGGGEVATQSLANMSSRWHAYRHAFLNHFRAESCEISARVAAAAAFLQDVSACVEAAGFIRPGHRVEVDQRIARSAELLARARELSSSSSNVAGRFEWVDGVILEAIERGYWLLMDNVNFCSPSVLDRLNPLLEPGGELVINERGLVGGEPRRVRPHPNFRLFMTMDPSNGEISRAMRNRGLEFFVDAPNACSLAFRRLLGSAGVRRGVVLDALVATHDHFSATSGADCTPRDLLRAAQLYESLLYRGTGVVKSLRLALSLVYARRQAPALRAAGAAFVRDQLSRVGCTPSCHTQRWTPSDFSDATGHPARLLRLSELRYLPDTWPRSVALRLQAGGMRPEVPNLGEVTSEVTSRFIVERNLVSLSCSQLLVSVRPERVGELAAFLRMRAPSLHPLQWAAEALLHGSSPWAAAVGPLLAGVELGTDALSAARRLVGNLASATTGPILDEIFDTPAIAQLRHIARAAVLLFVEAAASKRALYVFRAANLPCGSSLLEVCAALSTGGVVPPGARQMWANLPRALRSATEQVFAVYADLPLAACSALLPIARRVFSLDRVVPETLERLVDLCVAHSQLGDELMLSTDMLGSSARLLSLLDRMGRALSADSELATCYGQCIAAVSVLREASSGCAASQSAYAVVVRRGFHPALYRRLDAFTADSAARQLAAEAATVARALSSATITGALISARARSMKYMLAISAVNELGPGDDRAASSLIDDVLQAAPVAVAELRAAVKKTSEDAAVVASSADGDMLVQKGPEPDGRVVALAGDMLLSLSMFADAFDVVVLATNAASAGWVPSAEDCSTASALVTRVVEVGCTLLLLPVVQLAPFAVLQLQLDGRGAPGARAAFASGCHLLARSWFDGLWGFLYDQQSMLLAVEGSASTRPRTGSSLLYEGHVTKLLLGMIHHYSSGIPLANLSEQQSRVSNVLSRVREMDFARQDPRAREHLQLQGGLQLLAVLVDDASRRDGASEGDLVIADAAAAERARDVLRTVFSAGSSVGSAAAADFVGAVAKCAAGSDVGPALDELAGALAACADAVASGVSAESDLQRAAALVYLRFVLASLVAPRDFIDPVAVAAVEHSLSSCAAQRLNDRCAMEAAAEAAVTGASAGGEWVDLLRAAASRHAARAAALEGKVVLRPGTRSFSEIVRSVQQFLQRDIPLARVKVIAGRCRAVLRGSALDRVAGESTVITESITGFIDRLEIDFAGFSDIVVPVAMHLSGLRDAIALLVRHAMLRADVHAPARAGMRAVAGYLLCGAGDIADSSVEPAALAALREYLVLRLSGRLPRGPRALRLWATFSRRCVALHDAARTRGSNVRSLYVSLLELVRGVYHAVEEQQRQEDAEKDSLFRTRDFKIEVVPEEEYVRQFFPDFHESFADASTAGDQGESGSGAEDEGEGDGPADDCGDSLAAAGRTRALMAELAPEDYAAIAEMHATMLGVAASPGCDAAALAMEAHGLLEASGGPPLYEDDRRFVGTLLAAMRGTARTDQYSRNGGALQRQMSERSLRDVYHGSAPEELALMREPLEVLRTRLLELLDEFLGNSVLLQILATVNRVRALPIGAPLMKALVGLEMLHEKISLLWQPVASRAVTLQAHLDVIGKLILRWRRLELSSWPSILGIQHLRHAHESDRWWFRLAALVEHVARSADLSEDLVVTLDSFIRSSSLGQFGRRLELIALFRAHVRVFHTSCLLGEVDSPSNQALRRLDSVLFNLHAYYAQFSAGVSRRLDGARAPIEQKLRDFVKIARWDDVNYFAMKSSADKSHRKLTKMARKFQEALTQPADGILVAIDEQLQPLVEPALTTPRQAALRTRRPRRGGRPATVGTWTEVFDCLGACDLAQEPALFEACVVVAACFGTQQWLALGIDGTAGTAVDLQRRLARVRSLVRELAGGRGADGFSVSRDVAAADAFFGEVAEEAAALQAPDIGKPQKALALRSFIKELRSRGFSVLRSASPAEQRRPTFFMEGAGSQEPPAVTDFDIWRGRADALWRAADGYFFRGLQRLARLRELAPKPHADVSVLEASRALNLTEHMAHLLLRARELRSGWAQLESDAWHTSRAFGPGASAPASAPFVEWAPHASKFAAFLETGGLAIAIANDLGESVSLAGGDSARWTELSRQLCAYRDTAIAALPPIAIDCDACGQLRAVLDRVPSGLKIPANASPAVLLSAATQALIAVSNDTLCSMFVDAAALLPADQLDVATRAFARIAVGLRECASPVAYDETDGPSDEVFCSVSNGLRSLMLAVQAAWLLEKEFSSSVKRWVLDEPDKLDEPDAHSSEQVEGGADDGAPSTGADMVRGDLGALVRFVGDLFAAVRSAGVGAGIPAALATCGYGRLDAEDRSAVWAVAAAAFGEYLALVRWGASLAAGVAKALSKGFLVSGSVFSTLVARGYCQPDKDEDGGEGEESGGGKHDVELDGTGMADAEGREDVSDQITDIEQQMTGTKQESKEDKPDQKAPRPPNDDGIEVEEDFDGELEDVPEEGEAPEGEEKEEQERDEDREMGDLDREKQEVLDERLWDEEDKADNDGRDDENPRDDGVDRSSKATGVDEDDRELGAKDLEQDGAEGNDKQQKKERPQKGPEKKQRQDDDAGDDDAGEAAGDADGSGDADGDEDNEADSSGGDEDGDKEDRDAAPLYEGEGTGKDVAPQEEFEIPEDLELDDDDKAGAEGMDEEGEDEGDGDGDGDGDGMNEDDGEMDEGAESFERPPERVDETADADGNLLEEQPHGIGDLNEEAPPNVGGPDAEGDTGADADGADANGSDGDDPDADAPEESVLPDELDGKSAYDAAVAEQMQSVNDATGFRSGTRADVNSELETRPDASDADRETAEEQHNAQNMAASDAGETRRDAAPQQATSGERGRSKRERMKPNPFRSLGEAARDFLRDVDVVDETDEQEEHPGEGAQQDDAAAGSSYEFVKEDEQKAMDALPQALGAAAPDQVRPMDTGADEPDEDDDADSAGDMKIEPPEPAPDDRGANASTVALRAGAPLRRAPPKHEERDASGADVEDDADAGVAEDGDMEAVAVQEAGETKPERISRPETRPGALEDPDAEVEAPARAAAAEETPVMTAEDVQAMREALESRLALWRGDVSAVDRAVAVWKKFDAITAGSSAELCEQLRLILEPTLAMKLKGDYRTGKRINMKKVIPYIASQFKKDKIWLRRTQPNKRQYQVLVAVDDSRSMADNRAGAMALEALAMVAKALTQLEVGDVSVASFGETFELLHPFGTPFTWQSGVHVVSHFGFDQDGTNMVRLLETSVQMMALARAQQTSTGADCMQLMFILSDGRFGVRSSSMRRWVHEAASRNLFLVFVIIDSASADDSILNLTSVSFVGGRVQRSAYLEDFVFPYYLVLRDTARLPALLADALRQWFELMSHL
jgi:midasin